jgi:general stress protein YciG
MNTDNKSKRGFASMSKDKQREIASMGGKSAHEIGSAHQFTRSEAVAAGQKGGKSAHANGTRHKFSHDKAVEAGRKGGRISRKKKLLETS